MDKMILFDLDGTLLPMDQDRFTDYYFGCLAQWMSPYGFEPQALIKAVWKGTAAMVANDGSRTNEERFWEVFDAQFETPASENYKHFLKFYEQGFAGARKATGFNPRAAETVHRLKTAGYRVALATNPLFPRIATEQRIRWAGLEPEDFELYTTYENSRTCKPNPQYYVEVAESLGVRPQDCIMIGNDADEDVPAATVGMKVFLLTDSLLNRRNLPLDEIPHGGYDELHAWLGLAQN